VHSHDAHGAVSVGEVRDCLASGWLDAPDRERSRVDPIHSQAFVARSEAGTEVIIGQIVARHHHRPVFVGKPVDDVAAIEVQTAGVGVRAQAELAQVRTVRIDGHSAADGHGSVCRVLEVRVEAADQPIIRHPLTPLETIGLTVCAQSTLRHGTLGQSERICDRALAVRGNDIGDARPVRGQGQTGDAGTRPEGARGVEGFGVLRLQGCPGT